jgi:GDP-D-mannose dehydratase
VSSPKHREPKVQTTRSLYLGTVILAALGTALSLWLGNIPASRDWGQMINYLIGLTVGSAVWEWAAIRP